VNGRKIEDVKAEIALKRRELDRAISRQSFYCLKSKRVVSPAECHDCFNDIPYIERLSKWKEDRQLCIKEHSRNTDPKQTKCIKRKTSDESTNNQKVVHDYDSALDDITPDVPFSVEEYLSRGLLNFFLELDSLGERFEAWWASITPEVRSRMHMSAEFQEAILWFAERLREFQASLLRIARTPEQEKNDSKQETKEE
jgi:hypothetical protein